jgi:hypothetical protein
MKATKKDINLFGAIYDKMVRSLVNDLNFYKEFAKQAVMEAEYKAINIHSPIELEGLSKMFVLHRIGEFNGYENAGESALKEVYDLLKAKDNN